ncbi:hypothetical protein D6855_01490 [Butyrivibrio sp. CB08]|uniref:transglutaminase domain-containing protein n=1 Tax=Butyrivibrio sp. CB08 TaxID=2364879 RepID=UPI000EAA4A13|nr:transglutaminase domain-containing protein [Butyrivibrio sp. CB08]RKM62123.1 hypothetical protein D6855_01490 [Butyrivibrio sp. CB08]
MKKKWPLNKSEIAFLLAAAILSATLSGCQYESFDDYLRALGMKDPVEYEEAVIDESVSEITLEETSEEPAVEYVDISEYTDVPAEIGVDRISDNGVPSGHNEYPDGAPVKADSDYASFYKSYDDAPEEITKKREEVGLTDSGIEKLKKQQEGLYAYDRLTDAGKTLYVEMLAIMEHLATDVSVSTTSDEAIELVFEHVSMDHPELFYVGGYQYTDYRKGEETSRIAFSGTYLYDEAEVKSRQTQINEAVNKCLAGAPATPDEYYKVKYVYEYIIKNTEYDKDAPDNQNLCSVFIGGRSVCNGYAKATQYLLNKMGVKCTFVTGMVTTKSGQQFRHAWNLVLCNGVHYYLDVTWGDASYQTASGESADPSLLPEVNYDYLNVTTEEILRQHTLSDIISFPVCSGMADNYYVREGEYFTAAEPALIQDLFNRKYEEGAKCVTFKCASDAVYDAIFDHLFTQSHVFDYMQGYHSTVTYTAFEKTRTIMIWL